MWDKRHLSALRQLVSAPACLRTDEQEDADFNQMRREDALKQRRSEPLTAVVDFDLFRNAGQVPPNVTLRLHLNALGFEFHGDDRLTAVTDENPVPKYRTTYDCNYHDRTLTVKQYKTEKPDDTE